MLTVYTYAKCSTCRAATKWLQERGVPFEERPIRETPPSVAELRRMLAARDGEIRRLFNTSGALLRNRVRFSAGAMPILSSATRP